MLFSTRHSEYFVKKSKCAYLLIVQIWSEFQWKIFIFHEHIWQYGWKEFSNARESICRDEAPTFPPGLNTHARSDELVKETKANRLRWSLDRLFISYYMCVPLSCGKEKRSTFWAALKKVCWPHEIRLKSGRNLGRKNTITSDSIENRGRS